MSEKKHDNRPPTQSFQDFLKGAERAIGEGNKEWEDAPVLFKKGEGIEDVPEGNDRMLELPDEKD